MTATVAWLLFPALLTAVAVGLGLLARRLLRLDLALVLVLPLGACVHIAVAYAAFRLGGDAAVVGPMVLLGAAAGWIVSIRAGISRAGGRRLAVPALVAIATYLLFLGPVLASGDPTFTGYNFVNDTAVQLTIADRLAEQGAVPPAGPGDDTRSAAYWAYASNSYPLGTHALLAPYRALPATELMNLYQPLLAWLLGAGALALWWLLRRSGLPPWLAGVGAAVAVGANLTYAYALQGNIKEIGVLCALLTTAALVRHLLDSSRPVATAAAVGITSGAAVLTWQLAAVPILGVLAFGLAGWILVGDSRRLRTRLPAIAVIGTATFVVVALPVLVGALTFAKGATTGALADQLDFGQLRRSLEMIQIGGVWLGGDYRIPPESGLAAATSRICDVAVLVAALGGVVALIRRREPGLLIFLAALAVGWLVIAPRASPYSDAKLMAVASPAIVGAAVIGLYSLRRLVPAAAALLATGLALAVLTSNALSYDDVKLAPTARLEALRSVDRYLADTKGQVLVNEPEDYGKYLARESPMVFPYEAHTPFQLAQTPVFYNLDEVPGARGRRWAAIVTRRSPVESRPPAIYVQTFSNRYYVVWERRQGETLERHIPAGNRFERSAVLDCDTYRDLLGQPGRLVAAVSPLAETRPPQPEAPDYWVAHETIAEDVVPKGPERLAYRFDLPGDRRYEVWLRGSFGRELRVSVDGRPVGVAAGHNPPGQYADIGSVVLGPGRTHEVVVDRGQGTLAPGTGSADRLGALVLQAAGDQELITVTRGNVRDVCRQRVDWLELLRPTRAGRTVSSAP
ncbi:MAG: hypothetical protein ACR2NA_10460 [Solirubrobacterales bacterium]